MLTLLAALAVALAGCVAIVGILTHGDDLRHKQLPPGVPLTDLDLNFADREAIDALCESLCVTCRGSIRAIEALEEVNEDVPLPDGVEPLFVPTEVTLCGRCSIPRKGKVAIPQADGTIRYVKAPTKKPSLPYAPSQGLAKTRTQADILKDLAQAYSIPPTIHGSPVKLDTERSFCAHCGIQILRVVNPSRPTKPMPTNCESCDAKLAKLANQRKHYRELKALPPLQLPWTLDDYRPF